jgi:biotin carboxyl carrier protein
MAEKKTNVNTNKGQNACFETKDGEQKCKTLIVHGTKYKTFLTKKYENRKKWQKVNEYHEINSIPGTIIKVFIKEGATVKRGEPLMILEAMKMQNKIFAPFDCSVKKVNVKVNDKIPKGTLMLEYE